MADRKWTGQRKAEGALFDTPENRFLLELPDHVRGVARELLDRSWPPQGSVSQLVESHLGALRVAQEQNEFLDLGLANRIATACVQLERAMGEEPQASHVRIVRAAVLYFVQDDDVESDTSSVLGLDDDAAVVGAAARAIGRADLAPELT